MRVAVALVAVGLAAALSGGCFDFDRVLARGDAAAPFDAAGPATDGAVAPACGALPMNAAWSTVPLPASKPGAWIQGLVPGDPIFVLGLGGLAASQSGPGWTQLGDAKATHYYGGTWIDADTLAVTGGVNATPGVGLFKRQILGGFTEARWLSIPDISATAGIAWSGTQVLVGGLSYFPERQPNVGAVTFFPRDIAYEQNRTDMPGPQRDLLATPRGIFACGYGYILRLDTASKTWVNDLPVIAPFLEGCVDLAATVTDDGGAPRTRLWAVVGDGNRLCSLDDVEPAWDCYPLPFGTNAITASPCDAGTVAAVGFSGKVGYSRNRGARFDVEPAPTSEALNAALITTDGLLYVGGNNGAFFVRR